MDHCIHNKLLVQYIKYHITHDSPLSCFIFVFLYHMVCNHSPLLKHFPSIMENLYFHTFSADTPHLLITYYPPSSLLIDLLIPDLLLSEAMDKVVDFCTQKWPYGPEACLLAFALFHAVRVSVVPGSWITRESTTFGRDT